MRTISWKKTENLKAFREEFPYDEGMKTVYAFQSAASGEREVCVREAGAPEPYPGKFLQTDALTLAVVELTGQSESRILACAPELEGRIEISDAPEEDVVEVARARKRIKLRKHRDAIVAEGYRYEGYVFPLTEDVKLAMLMQFQSSQLPTTPPEYVFSWKDMGEVYREIGNAQAFQMFALGAMGYGQSLYAWEEMLQTMVNAAATVEAVEAITWDTVPDGPV